jgi:hypothetical protein
VACIEGNSKEGILMTVSSKVPNFSIDSLRFDPASVVLPSHDRLKASRFLVPIPAFPGSELRYPAVYPVDMRQRDSTRHPLAGKPHPKSGHPLEDWRGRPILEPDGSVPHGVVFFNYEDAIFQGVRSSGDGIVIFDRPTPDQARELQSFVLEIGGPSALKSTELVATVLQRAQQMGLDDRYDSTLAYAEKSLTPVREVATGIPAFGLHLRSNEMVRAVFVPGPAQVGDLKLGAEGGVFLLISVNDETDEREVRSVSPAAFADTYTARDGSRLTSSSLPQERPWGRDSIA